MGYLTLVLMCRATCEPLDSASFSAELPQGLEQDEQMDLPLANVQTLNLFCCQQAL